MNIITYLQESLNLDVWLMLIVFLSGFFQERFTDNIRISRNDKSNAAYKTFLVSLLAGTIYVWLAYYELPDKTVPLPWAKYFISYFTATSLYELAIRPFRKWWKKKFSEDDQPKTAL